MSPFEASVRSILPETLLVATGCVQFLVGPFLVEAGRTAPQKRDRAWGAVSLAALAAALWLWYQFPAPESHGAAGVAFRSDSFSTFFRGVAIVLGLVLVLVNWGEMTDEFAAEFHGVLLMIVRGGGVA